MAQKYIKTLKKAHKKVLKKASKGASKEAPKKVLKKASKGAPQEIQGWDVQTINDYGLNDANLNLVIQVFKTHMSTLNNPFYIRLKQLCAMVSFELNAESMLGTVFKIKCIFLGHTKYIIDINLDQATIHFEEENSSDDTDHNMIRSFWLLLTQKLITAGFKEV